VGVAYVSQKTANARLAKCYSTMVPRNHGDSAIAIPSGKIDLQRLWYETIQDDIMENIEPTCIHGDLHMQHVYVTVHSHVQLKDWCVRD
jgi:hypothetical protein